jgi:hypothetical protein
LREHDTGVFYSLFSTKRRLVGKEYQEESPLKQINLSRGTGFSRHTWKRISRREKRGHRVNVSGGKEIARFASSGGKTHGILSLDEFFPRLWPLHNPRKSSALPRKQSAFPPPGKSPPFNPRPSLLQSSLFVRILCIATSGSGDPEIAGAKCSTICVHEYTLIEQEGVSYLRILPKMGENVWRRTDEIRMVSLPGN